MVSNHYYELLESSPGASLAEVKAAYHRVAKRSHPDLFPEAERELHEIRMMQINEAYMAIVCDRAGAPGKSRIAARIRRSSGRRHRSPDPDRKEVGTLRDPAYTYYKLGFRYFSEGRRTLSKHYVFGGQRIDFSTENIRLLKLAVASLHYFHKAYSCFERVSTAYPSSLWARDAGLKIYYLNRYNSLYQRICDNLSKQISMISTPQARDAAED